MLLQETILLYFIDSSSAPALLVLSQQLIVQPRLPPSPRDELHEQGVMMFLVLYFFKNLTSILFLLLRGSSGGDRRRWKELGSDACCNASNGAGRRLLSLPNGPRRDQTSFRTSSVSIWQISTASARRILMQLFMIFIFEFVGR